MEGRSIIISQPYYFPWIGFFEQIRLSDILVYYDDVQFSKGHFQDRVQIKTPNGFKWLTIPKKSLKLGQNINDVLIDNSKNWKKSQIEFLIQNYNKAPFLNDMLKLLRNVFDNNFNYLHEITICSITVILEYFGLLKNLSVSKSSELQIGGSKSQRIIDIVKHFNASRYITGMGALKYLDFESFVKNNISVHFLDYKKKPYPQLHGEFNPHVSILDLITNTGKDGIAWLCSETVDWKTFINSTAAGKYLVKQTSQNK